MPQIDKVAFFGDSYCFDTIRRKHHKGKDWAWYPPTPTYLDLFSQKNSIKVIHISSDCIFNGIKGNFKEKDIRLAKDIYGQSKYIAELILKNSLVIRSSTIGHEIFYKHGLLEWFLYKKK